MYYLGFLLASWEMKIKIAIPSSPDTLCIEIQLTLHFLLNAQVKNLLPRHVNVRSRHTVGV